MAASIKVSELQILSQLSDVDLFLVSDMETGTSRRVSYTDLKTNLLTDTTNALVALESTVQSNHASALSVIETNHATSMASDASQVQALEAFKAHIEDRNLKAGLSLGMLYVENFTGG